MQVSPPTTIFGVCVVHLLSSLADALDDAGAAEVCRQQSKRLLLSMHSTFNVAAPRNQQRRGLPEEQKPLNFKR